jgi:hypothetical protein
VFEKTYKETAKIHIWTIVESSVLDKPVLECKNTGVRFNFENLSDTPTMDIIFHLWPGDWKEQLRNWNVAIKRHNDKFVSKRKSEFVTGVNLELSFLSCWLRLCPRRQILAES